MQVSCVANCWHTASTAAPFFPSQFSSGSPQSVASPRYPEACLSAMVWLSTASFCCPPWSSALSMVPSACPGAYGRHGRSLCDFFDSITDHIYSLETKQGPTLMYSSQHLSLAYFVCWMPTRAPSHAGPNLDYGFWQQLTHYDFQVFAEIPCAGSDPQ
jgi:hypothetical protein